jgi:hypothetical protein
MSNLTLNVKKKWFDMILSGEKKEEYREIKPHWYKLCPLLYPTIKYDTVTFLNGMKKQTPTIVIECVGIERGKAVPEWSDNWQGEVFVIKLGEIISTKNITQNETN